MLHAEMEKFLTERIEEIKSIQALLVTQQKLCDDWAEEIKSRGYQPIQSEKQSEFTIRLSELMEAREKLIQPYLDKLSEVELDQLAKDCETHGLKDLFKRFIEVHQSVIRINELIQVAFSKLISKVAENVQYVVQSHKMSSVYTKKPVDIYHADTSRFFDQSS